jgi:hypothetical protein
MEGAEERTDQESDGDHPVRVLGNGIKLCAPCQQCGRDHGEHTQHFPFGLQEGTGAIGDVARQLLHVFVPGILLVHPEGLADHHRQAYQAHHRDVVHQITSHRFLSWLFSCPSEPLTRKSGKRGRENSRTRGIQVADGGSREEFGTPMAGSARSHQAPVSDVPVGAGRGT